MIFTQTPFLSFGYDWCNGHGQGPIEFETKYWLRNWYRQRHELRQRHEYTTWKGHGHGRCIVVSEEDEEGSSGVVTKRTEKYMGKENSNTVLLVVVLVMGVALIFICFAMVAICYRSGPKCFVIVCVSASVWETQQLGCQLWGGLRIWIPTNGAQNQGCFQSGPNWWRPMPLSVLCLGIQGSLWATIRVRLSQDTSAVQHCSPMCTKEWTYFVNRIVKYGRRTSCFVLSSFSIITVKTYGHHRGGGGRPSLEVFPFHQMLLATLALLCHIITITIWPANTPTPITFMQIPSFSQSSSKKRSKKQDLMQTFFFSLWLLPDPLRLHTTSSLLSPFSQHLLSLLSLLRLNFFKSRYFCTLHVCLCLCVCSQRERQWHRDHGDRARRWRRRNLHAFCRHGALLQVSPECQHFHFFAFSFLSLISQLLLDHLFLSASRQFCRIRPQPISISVHHTAAFLTLLQNFVTFLDAFPVVQPSGEFPSLDWNLWGVAPLLLQHWWHSPHCHYLDFDRSPNHPLFPHHQLSLIARFNTTKVYNPVAMVVDIL